MSLTVLCIVIIVFSVIIILLKMSYQAELKYLERQYEVLFGMIAELHREKK